MSIAFDVRRIAVDRYLRCRQSLQSIAAAVADVTVADDAIPSGCGRGCVLDDRLGDVCHRCGCDLLRRRRHIFGRRERFAANDRRHEVAALIDLRLFGGAVVVRGARRAGTAVRRRRRRSGGRRRR